MRRCPGVPRSLPSAFAPFGRWLGAALFLGLLLAEAPAELAAQPTSRGQVVAVQSRLATLEAEIAAFQSAVSRSRASTSLRDCCAAELARVRSAQSELELESRKLASQFTNSSESASRAAVRQIDDAVRAVQEAGSRAQQARTTDNAGRALREFAGAVQEYKRITERLHPVDPLVLYRRLVEPVNECTLLVKKVCGDGYECPDSPGCPVALQLLERYNTASGEELEQTRFSCLIGLEDPIVFNRCEPGSDEDLRAAGLAAGEGSGGFRVGCSAGIRAGSTLFRIPGSAAASTAPLRSLR